VSFLTIQQQAELFAGYAFDLAKMKAVAPDGTRLNKGQFNVRFGGNIFSMDDENCRTTRIAWTAFTLNEAYRPPFI
jgi:hypothetical protein